MQDWENDTRRGRAVTGITIAVLRRGFPQPMPFDPKTVYPKLINLMLDTVFLVDANDRIVFVSDACEALLGYRPDEMVGRPITDFMHPDDVPATRASIDRVMSGQPHVDFCNRYLRKDAGVVYILWSARWSEEDEVRIGVARDVTKLRQAEEELRFLAHHDPLTGLTNRLLFTDRLNAALRSARRRDSLAALLFIDINDFKGINDAHGHAAGDRVLCAIARRLERCVRETDTVARMGGDEFTVLLTDVASIEAVTEKVERILEIMAEPLGADFAGIAMPSCSIGVACYPADGADADTLLRHADTNMYRLKKLHSKPD